MNNDEYGRDPAEYTEASYTPDIAAEVDERNGWRDRGNPLAGFDDPEKTASLIVDVIDRLLAHFVDCRNVGYELDCFTLATGAGYRDGKSVKVVAKRWGVSKAAVSKQCVKICDKFGFPPSAAMKSESSRESYAKSNRRNNKSK